jgi:hypothetical protein
MSAGGRVIDVANFSDTIAGRSAPTRCCHVPSIPWSHNVYTLVHG